MAKCIIDEIRKGCYDDRQARWWNFIQTFGYFEIEIYNYLIEKHQQKDYLTKEEFQEFVKRINWGRKTTNLKTYKRTDSINNMLDWFSANFHFEHKKDKYYIVFNNENDNHIKFITL